MATNVHASPASAMTAPARRRPRASANQIPSMAIGSAHQLAGRHREEGEQREGHEAVGVEEPDAEEEERDRERHRMDRGEPALIATHG